MRNDLKCGDFGGRRKDGTPCARAVDQPGRCHSHPVEDLQALEEHSPTDLKRRFVETCIYGGIEEDEICRALECTPAQLHRHYQDEINCSAVRANAKVAQTAFQMATSGKSKTMTIFWLKCRAGWSEKGPKKTERQERMDLRKEIEERLHSINQEETKLVFNGES